MAPEECRTIHLPVRGDKVLSLVYRLNSEVRKEGSWYVGPDYAVELAVKSGAGVEQSVEMVRTLKVLTGVFALAVSGGAALVLLSALLAGTRYLSRLSAPPRT